MTCTIEVRNVYGALKAYPVCTNAKLFAGMVGTKTLTRQTIEYIRDLGYTINSQANADWMSVQ